MSTRTAACACGALTITLKGEPELVSSCSCLECQKRTGSVFGVSAFFQKDQIGSTTGTPGVFKRGSDAGRTLAMNFCPDCGTTVYWELDMAPNHVAVAVGCFADPDFPSPTRTVWHSRKHHWVEFPDHFQKHAEGSE